MPRLFLFRVTPLLPLFTIFRRTPSGYSVWIAAISRPRLIDVPSSGEHTREILRLKRRGDGSVWRSRHFCLWIFGNLRSGTRREQAAAKTGTGTRSGEASTGTAATCSGRCATAGSRVQPRPAQASQPRPSALQQSNYANQGTAQRNHVFDGTRAPPAPVNANPGPKPSMVGVPVSQFKPQVHVTAAKPPPPPPRNLNPTGDPAVQKGINNYKRPGT